jgi:LacI family transcriptional regulator
LEKKMAVTIDEIAKTVGKSHSTVSRSLANHPRISEATKKEVKAVAKKLKYRPSQNAKALRLGKTNTIGIVVPDITNPFYTEYMRVVERACLKRGYQLSIMEYSLDSSRQRDCLKKILENGCDGAIVFIQEFVIIDDLLAEFRERNVPVINGLGGGADSDRIVVNFGKGTEKAIDHLVSLGHREIVLGCSQPKGSTDTYFEELRNRQSSIEIDQNKIMEDRILAFEIQLRQRGLHFGEENFIVNFTGNQLNDGIQAAKFFVSERPSATAVLAQNDYYASGFVQSLIEQGVRVPEDVSVIGSDNNWLAKFGPVPLTTINFDLCGIGETAVQLMFDEIDNEKRHKSTTIPFIPNLVVRDSTTEVRTR